MPTPAAGRQGCEHAARVVQPLSVIPCPEGQCCPPKNRSCPTGKKKGLWELGQQPWECQQHSTNPQVDSTPAPRRL